MNSVCRNSCSLGFVMVFTIITAGGCASLPWNRMARTANSNVHSVHEQRAPVVSLAEARRGEADATQATFAPFEKQRSKNPFCLIGRT